MVIINDEAQIINANPEASDIFGMEQKALLGQPLQQFSSNNFEFENRWHSFKTDGVKRSTATVVGANGVERQVEYSATANVVPDQHLIVSRDITDRERRQQELEEYETIIEALEGPVYVIDEDGRFTNVNDAFVDLVGYDQEMILGNTPTLIKPEYAIETAERHLANILSDDGPDAAMFEVTILPRDGEPIVCEDHMGVLPFEGDNFNGSVGTLRELTERKNRVPE